MQLQEPLQRAAGDYLTALGYIAGSDDEELCCEQLASLHKTCTFQFYLLLIMGLWEVIGYFAYKNDRVASNNC
jgi:hypothetical protein